MGTREILLMLALAVLGVGGSAVMTVGPDLYPEYKAWFFYFGLISVVAALAGIAFILFAGKIIPPFRTGFAVAGQWTEPVKGVIAILIGAFSAFWFGYWLSGLNAPRQPDPPVVVGIPVERITGFFRDHTNVQASLLVKPFIGAEVIATGVVADVYDFGDGDGVITLEAPTASPNVNLGFDEANFVAATRLTIGDPVSAKCVFQGQAGLAGVSVKDCHLIAVSPSPAS